MILIMIYELCARRQMPCSSPSQRSHPDNYNDGCTRRIFCVLIFMVMIVRYFFSFFVLTPCLHAVFLMLLLLCWRDGKFIQIWWFSKVEVHCFSYRLSVVRSREQRERGEGGGKILWYIFHALLSLPPLVFFINEDDDRCDACISFIWDTFYLPFPLL